jgi:hypothetical protein
MVIAMAVPPDEGTLKISPLYSKAIHCPSGEIAGLRSHLGVLPVCPDAKKQQKESREKRSVFILKYLIFRKFSRG